MSIPLFLGSVVGNAFEISGNAMLTTGLAYLLVGAANSVINKKNELLDSSTPIQQKYVFKNDCFFKPSSTSKKTNYTASNTLPQKQIKPLITKKPFTLRNNIRNQRKRTHDQIDEDYCTKLPKRTI